MSLSLSGVTSILAHEIKLILQENSGGQHQQVIRDIFELFLGKDVVQTLNTQTVTIAPGQSYTRYFYDNPDDSQVPGLESLLLFLQQNYKAINDPSTTNNFYTIHKHIRSQILNSDMSFTKQIRNTSHTNVYNSYYETQQRIVNKHLAIENHDAFYSTKKSITQHNHKSYHFEEPISFVKKITDQSTKYITNNNTTINKRSLQLENYVSQILVKRVLDQHVSVKRYDILQKDDHHLTQVQRTVNNTHRHTHEILQRSDIHQFHKHVRQQTIKRTPVWMQIDQHFTFNRTGLISLTWAAIVGRPSLYTQAEVDALLALKVDSTTFNNLLALKANSADVYTQAQTNNLLSAKANSVDVYTQGQVNNLLNAKANSSDVYSRSHIDNALAGKASTSSVANKRDISDSYSISQIDAQNATQDANITANSQSIINSQIDISMLQIADNGLQAQINNMTPYSTFTSTINAIQTYQNWLTNEVSTLKNTLFNTQVKIGSNYFTPEVLEITGSGYQSASFNNNTKVLTVTFQ